MSLYSVRTPRFIQYILPSLGWVGNHEDVLLTFDDGPYPQTTPWILDYLDRLEIKAIFFVQGVNVVRYPTLFKDIIQRGHRIGNHGYEHHYGWKLSLQDFVDNVERGAEVSGSYLYRPSYGQIGLRQYRAIRDRHEVMMWSVMPGDFIKGINVEQRMEKVNKSLQLGDIIVLHDNPEHFERMKVMLSKINIQV